MLLLYISVCRSSTSGKKNVSSVVLRDWSSANRRRRLSTGTSEEEKVQPELKILSTCCEGHPPSGASPGATGALIYTDFQDPPWEQIMVAQQWTMTPLPGCFISGNRVPCLSPLVNLHSSGDVLKRNSVLWTGFRWVKSPRVRNWNSTFLFFTSFKLNSPDKFLFQPDLEGTLGEHTKLAMHFWQCCQRYCGAREQPRLSLEDLDSVLPQPAEAPVSISKGTSQLLHDSQICCQEKLQCKHKMQDSMVESTRRDRKPRELSDFSATL